MGRLQTWGAAARRSRLVQVLAAVVVLALVAGSIVLVTRSAGPPAVPPAPEPPPTTRAVALGDSVPYGHGLANPYLTPQIGLPTDAVSQGPSDAGLSDHGGRGPRAHHDRAPDELSPRR